VRRGAAWPARPPSGCLVVRGHNTGARLGVRSLGVAAKEGPDAGCAVVTVSGIRCPVSGASVRCPRGACPRDWCPVRASERPGVQCPASVRCGVRGVRRHEVTGCGGGPAAVRLGWPGSGWSPAVSMTAGRLPEVGAWPSKLAQAVLGQRRVTWSSSWEVVSSRPSRPGEAGACEVRPLGTAAGGDHAAWSLCEAWAWVGWSLSGSGRHGGLSWRPQRGRNLQ
jgi:hypothetical protein